MMPLIYATCGKYLMFCRKFIQTPQIIHVKCILGDTGPQGFRTPV